ncbi:hypothetical protein EI983_03935 [Roseovarius faecimaris]|uniref:Polysaccharide lyase-like protein n=1 Tax=Roseovarius faecimaris TaxID=2494550 RepID=A0A6I6INT0_9RHOB|nr:hypothetical protein [Roseovarius faecimaris]QGX97473.1 hypothetical protein EI983_03935 [Roseovarius faecimaris]
MERDTGIADQKPTKSLLYGKAMTAFALSMVLMFPGLALGQNFELNTPREGAPFQEADGSHRFHLLPGECSDQEYFSTELQAYVSDCARGRNRIEYYETTAASAGDRRLYEWEIFIPEDFSYSAMGARLTAVQFETGTDMLYGFELNNDALTFRSRDCIPAEEFGQWHSISVRIQYDSTPRKSLKDQTPGVFVVECNGAVVADSSGRPNLAEGGKIQFRYGLFGAMDISDTDNVAVSYRNVRVSEW